MLFFHLISFQRSHFYHRFTGSVIYSVHMQLDQYTHRMVRCVLYLVAVQTFNLSGIAYREENINSLVLQRIRVSNRQYEFSRRRTNNNRKYQIIHSPFIVQLVVLLFHFIISVVILSRIKCNGNFGSSVIVPYYTLGGFDKIDIKLKQILIGFWCLCVKIFI